MKHLDLFSGIGGFALAAKWTWGDEHEIISFCELEKFCKLILNKHWPKVEIHDDIKTLSIDTIVNHCYIRLPEQQKEIVNMAAHRKDYDEAVGMYERGLSIQSLADFYQITRQAMWMILKRRGCTFRDNKRYGEDNHFYRGTTADDRAQNILENAIKNGIIERKVMCEKCGNVGTFKDGRTAIQAHHPDYNKPLDVMWFCQKCHHEWHKNNKSIQRKEVPPDEVSESTRIDLLTGGFP